jgi:glycosyltransferase involved in cell wall biosynthesis
LGDGPLKHEVEKLAIGFEGIQIHVAGALNREELNEYYKRSHVLVLPSASEGFPKVIAEASAYGCIPVATALSAIPQYVSHLDNGFLLKDNNPDTIANALNELMRRNDLALISTKATDLSAQFTYERYVDRVRNDIFNL